MDVGTVVPKYLFIGSGSSTEGPGRPRFRREEFELNSNFLIKQSSFQNAHRAVLLKNDWMDVARFLPWA